MKSGRYMAKDVDFALITPPYSKDVVEQRVDKWFDKLAIDIKNNRIPAQWVEGYRASYQAWKRGEEMPPEGTAIKGWGVISPAQQENLIRINVLTVEDLAVINDEGLKRIGMGARDLKNKAVAWLSQLRDKGALTMEMASVKNENEQLRATVGVLESKLNELLAAIKQDDDLNGADSIGAMARRRGRPPKNIGLTDERT
jgi:hypothetical protein